MKHLDRGWHAAEPPKQVVCDQNCGNWPGNALNLGAAEGGSQERKTVITLGRSFPIESTVENLVWKTTGLLSEAELLKADKRKGSWKLPSSKFCK